MESKSQQVSLTGGANLKIHSVNFSFRGDYFTIGTSEGFLVYQTCPHQLISKTSIQGGVRTAQIVMT